MHVELTVYQQRLCYLDSVVIMLSTVLDTSF